MPYEVKSLNEECGVFGVWGHSDAASITYFGLHSLQHRGQEGAGIVSNDQGKLLGLSLIHISEPTRRTPISYAVFCLKKKKKKTTILVHPTTMLFYDMLK